MTAFKKLSRQSKMSKDLGEKSICHIGRDKDDADEKQKNQPI